MVDFTLTDEQLQLRQVAYRLEAGLRMSPVDRACQGARFPV
jgi:hypothetical protein